MQTAKKTENDNNCFFPCVCCCLLCPLNRILLFFLFVILWFSEVHISVDNFFDFVNCGCHPSVLDASFELTDQLHRIISSSKYFVFLLSRFVGLISGELSAALWRHINYLSHCTRRLVFFVWLHCRCVHLCISTRHKLKINSFARTSRYYSA